MAIKLYQDYKIEKEKERQIEEDKNAIELGENVVVIYEKSGFASRLLGILGFIAVMAALGAGIIGIFFYFLNE